VLPGFTSQSLLLIPGHLSNELIIAVHVCLQTLQILLLPCI
jgi:hypothetical protein